ncbi:MAG: CotH kinase family protein [Bacteroidales bacterium]|nr:CotH kinase family protein [Bacteroidales bacterium]
MKKVLLLLAMMCSASVACDRKPDDGSTGEQETVLEDQYLVATINIDTENAEPIVEKKKKIPCTITIDHPNDAWDLTATGTVRGRGNSTWLWYDKKPYRFKLDEKASVLGLDPEKDWVLLANYRDPSHMMNTFVFELGHRLGLPYTNHSRYVELTLNGEFLGLYQLTEQVEQGGSRVDVDDAEGMLISLDADDGPGLSPDAEDNFWSEVYGLPICVKYPEDEELEARFDAIIKDFAKLEKAVKGAVMNYKAVEEVLDVQSFIDYMMIQELVYNVEVDAPRSIYMHKDKGGKWAMGPLWDFDAGFDFDWGQMYSGHNYFADYKELVLGTNPFAQKGANYHVNKFFTDLFGSSAFKEAYKARWNEIKPTLLDGVWKNIDKYCIGAEDAMARNAELWPIYAPSDDNPVKEIDYSVEIVNMYSWLLNRIDYLDPIINNY